MTLIDASKAIDMKLNDAKRHLINKYGDNVHKFFRQNPGAEDRMLYAYYKMPNKFLERLKDSKDIESMYKIYTQGGLNKAFEQVDNYWGLINSYMKNEY